MHKTGVESVKVYKVWRVIRGGEADAEWPLRSYGGRDTFTASDLTHLLNAGEGLEFRVETVEA